jgi:hypothetical protein
MKITPASCRWLIYGIALITVLVQGYKRSAPVTDRAKLEQADAIYQELSHPAWSSRAMRETGKLPNLGSGNHRMLHLLDVRKVSIPMEEALAYYRAETERLGFRECHVEAAGSDKAKRFGEDWARLGWSVPPGADILVIAQIFSSDSTVRAHAADP